MSGPHVSDTKPKLGSDFTLDNLSSLKTHFADAGGAGRIYPVRMGNGQSVWVKEALGRKYTTKRVVSGLLLSSLVGHPLLKSVFYINPAEGLGFEARRLREFSHVGINVPDVLYETDRHLVLQHIGQGAHEVMKEGDVQGAQRVAVAVLGALRDMHEAGVVHGDAIIKNFTVQVGLRVGVIDLESTPDLERGFHSLAARDIWGYVYSLSRGYGGAHFEGRDVLAQLVSGYIDGLKPDARAQVAKDLTFMACSARGVFASAIKGVRVHKTLHWHQRAKAAVLAAV